MSAHGIQYFSSSQPNSKGENCSKKKRREGSGTEDLRGERPRPTSLHCHHASIARLKRAVKRQGEFRIEEERDASKLTDAPCRCDPPSRTASPYPSKPLQTQDDQGQLRTTGPTRGTRDLLQGLSCRIAVRIGIGSSPFEIFGATLLQRNHSRCSEGIRSFQMLMASSLEAVRREEKRKASQTRRARRDEGVRGDQRSQR